MVHRTGFPTSNDLRWRRRVVASRTFPIPCSVVSSYGSPIRTDPVGLVCITMLGVTHRPVVAVKVVGPFFTHAAGDRNSASIFLALNRCLPASQVKQSDLEVWPSKREFVAWFLFVSSEKSPW